MSSEEAAMPTKPMYSLSRGRIAAFALRVGLPPDEAAGAEKVPNQARKTAKSGDDDQGAQYVWRDLTSGQPRPPTCNESHDPSLHRFPQTRGLHVTCWTIDAE